MVVIFYRKESIEHFFQLLLVGLVIMVELFRQVHHISLAALGKAIDHHLCSKPNHLPPTHVAGPKSFSVPTSFPGAVLEHVLPPRIALE